jgi:hypothetical protein
MGVRGRCAVAWCLTLVLVTGTARADPLDDEQQALNGTVRRLMTCLVIDGAVGIVGGAALLIPDGADQAFRVAGASTMIFGAINFAIGVSALMGKRGEDRAWREHRPADARRALLDGAHHEEVLFAINLGLDVGYAIGGVAAILASQLGADHPDRWMAAGVATVVQAVALAAIDLAGTVAASRAFQRRLAVAPLVGFSPSGATVGLGGVF